MELEMIRSKKVRNIKQIVGDAKLDRDGMLKMNYNGELLKCDILKGKVSFSNVTGHVLFSGEPRTPFKFSIMIKEKRTRRTNTRPKLTKELDSLTSKLLFKMTAKPHRCYFAGKDHVKCGGHLCCNHIVSKARSHRLRWDMRNVVIGCAGHNQYYHYHEDKLWELIAKHDQKLWSYLDSQKRLSGKGMGSESAMTLLKIDMKRKLERIYYETRSHAGVGRTKKKGDENESR